MIQRPFYPEGESVCHAYVLHPPGGIVGGDEIELSLEVGERAHALVTTPGANRWYFSRGIQSRMAQRATVADGAAFEWLPQETLIFDGAHARQSTRIELEGSARFCGWEILGLGRPALGEMFRNGSLDLRFELFRDSRPLLLERQHSATSGLPGWRENAACATFVATPANEVALESARELLAGVSDALCAATLIADVLVARALAPTCEPLMRVFSRLWSTIRPFTIGRPASLPRIWHT
jgi:urease accessory protein